MAANIPVIIDFQECTGISVCSENRLSENGELLNMKSAVTQETTVTALLVPGSGGRGRVRATQFQQSASTLAGAAGKETLNINVVGIQLKLNSCKH